MGAYIFITSEGETFQQGNISHDADVDNCQVIGFANGASEKEAFKNLKDENDYLLNTNFNELICIELKNEDYYGNAKYFYLGDNKKLGTLNLA
jgi:hypothetical protein